MRVYEETGKLRLTDKCLEICNRDTGGTVDIRISFDVINKNHDEWMVGEINASEIKELIGDKRLEEFISI